MSNLQSKWLLAFVLTLAAAAGFGLALPGGAPILRAVLGVYLVLVGPGLAFTTALLPPKQLGTAEHVLTTIVASIALAAIGGLLLDVTPWGLQPISWSVILAAVTVVASLAALLRLQRLGSRSGGMRSGGNMQVPTLRLALPIVAMALLALAIYVARMPAPAERYQGYTTLWLAPDGQQAGTQTGARLGIQSGEFEPTSYRLEVRVNGQVANVWPDLRLEPNQVWQAQLALPDAGRTALEIEAFLYRSDAPRVVYRQVRFGAGKTG